MAGPLTKSVGGHRYIFASALRVANIPLLIHCIPVRSKSCADVKEALAETHALLSALNHPTLKEIEG
eukprot:5539446-Amphidinium_carterae.1